MLADVLKYHIAKEVKKQTVAIDVHTLLETVMGHPNCILVWLTKRCSRPWIAIHAVSNKA